MEGLQLLCLIFVATAYSVKAANKDKVDLYLLDFQVDFMEKKLLDECKDYLERLKIELSINTRLKRSVGELLDDKTKILLRKYTLDELKLLYLNCTSIRTTTTTTTVPTPTTTTTPMTTTHTTTTTTMPTTTTSPMTTTRITTTTTMPTLTTTTSPMTTTHITTTTPTVPTTPETILYKEWTVYRGRWSWNNTAFELLRYVEINLDDMDGKTHNFWLLDVKIPVDGLAKTDTWCKDYENLCRNLGQRKTVGCGKGFYDGTPEYKTCLPYNMAENIPSTVMTCVPSPRIAEFAIVAFPGVPDIDTTGMTKIDVQKYVEGRSMAFKKCQDKGESCNKFVKKTHFSVTNMDLVAEKYGHRGYTVCYTPQTP